MRIWLYRCYRCGAAEGEPCVGEDGQRSKDTCTTRSYELIDDRKTPVVPALTAGDEAAP